MGRDKFEQDSDRRYAGHHIRQSTLPSTPEHDRRPSQFTGRSRPENAVRSPRSAGHSPTSFPLSRKLPRVNDEDGAKPSSGNEAHQQSSGEPKPGNLRRSKSDPVFSISSFFSSLLRHTRSKPGRSIPMARHVANTGGSRQIYRRRQDGSDEKTSSGRVKPEEIIVKRESFEDVVNTAYRNTKHKNVVADFSSTFGIRLTKGLLPLETRQLLLDDHTRCVATTKKLARCKNRIYLSSLLHNGNKAMISSPRSKAGRERGVENARYLVENVLCAGCHRRSAAYEFKMICEELPQLAPEDRAVFDAWGLALMPDSVEAEKKTAKIITLSQEISPDDVLPGIIFDNQGKGRYMTNDTSPSSPPHAASPPPIVFLDSPQNFERYEPRKTAGVSIQHAIHSLLTKPLTKSEIAEGTIYMYRVRGRFEYLKIGKTSDDQQEKRLDQWRRQCKHDIESLTSNLGMLPHACRAEALLHTALKQQRYREVGCQGCGTNHVEWFRVSVEHATRVYTLIADFMRTEPYVYVPDDYGTGTGWRLRKSISTKEMETFVADIVRAVAGVSGSAKQVQTGGGRRVVRSHRASSAAVETTTIVEPKKVSMCQIEVVDRTRTRGILGGRTIAVAA